MLPIVKNMSFTMIITAEIPDGNTYHVTTKKETAKASDERAKRSFWIPPGSSDTVVGSTSQEVL